MISLRGITIFICLIVIWACGKQTYSQGKRVYDAYCLQCHMADGQGLGALYPALSGSVYLSSNISELPCLIRNGKQSVTLSTVYMPAHKSLKPADLTNLINYMSATWGEGTIVQMADVNNQTSTCP